MHGSYRAKEGSVLAGLTQSMPLPTTLPAAVPDDADFAYVSVANADQLFADFGPLMDALIDIYPEDMRDLMRGYMAHVPELYKGFGNTSVSFGGFTPKGLMFDYYCDYPDDMDFAAALGTFMAKPEANMEAFGVKVRGPVAVRVAGMDASQFFLTFDYEKMTSMWAGTPGMDDQVMTDWIKTLYGETPVITIAQNKGRLWAHMGGTPRDQLQGAYRIRARPTRAASYFAGMPGLPSSIHPLLSYKMDLAAFVRQMKPILESAGLEINTPSLPLTLSAWMGVNGRDWIGGMTFSPKEWGALNKASNQPEEEIIIEAETFPAPK